LQHIIFNVDCGSHASDANASSLRFPAKVALSTFTRETLGMPPTTFDLIARARQAMLDAGFRPEFPPEVLAEVKSISAESPQNSTPPKDLRSLLWSSIDNETSRDLDQIEYAERNPDGSYRLLIGIADVDSLVPKSSKTDGYAASETTSVYAGVATFPMLPLDLSTNLTSLI